MQGLGTMMIPLANSVRRMGVVAVACLLGAAMACAGTDDAEILSILDDMAAEGDQFRTERLHELGLPGLCALLDRLLPDTADPGRANESRGRVARLVQQLGDEAYAARQSAAEEVFRLGPVVKPVLLEAVRSADAEISWRATRILRRWEAENNRDGSKHAAAFAAYVRAIDDQPRLEELARRAKIALVAGMPDDSRRELLLHCMSAVARSGEDRYCNVLEPLLRHEDVRVAVLVTETLGSESGDRYCPAVVVRALEADRPEVVAAAIKCVSNCQDASRRGEVERLLIAVFRGDNQQLKFLASLPLLQDFTYREAVDYLLGQVRSGDEEHREAALGLIGDSRNFGVPVSPEILAALRPMLRADSDRTRLTALRTLSIYAGEEVVKSLIPLLDDPNASLATEVGYRLQHQTDKAMLRRLLDSAAKNDPNEKIRRRAAAIVETLDGLR